MDFDLIGRELLVALRGRRTQPAWSRRLGYRSNVAYAWESGRRSPTAAEALRAARIAGVDIDGALVVFFGQRPGWLGELDTTTAVAAARILGDLRGQLSIVDLARRAGISRFSLSRWLDGTTEPKLGDFLRVIEAASVRMVDFVAALVEPARVPSVAPLWERLEARRRGAAALPWTQGLLRALELAQYQALPAHVPGWIAGRLGIDLDEEERCLRFCASTGQIAWNGARWTLPEVLAVDTRRDGLTNRRLKAHWTRVAAERIDAGAPGQFSYNVFTVSQADLERIRELHLAYFHQLRAIVAESTPGDCVAVVNVQLFTLDRPVE
jgi:DNA-binding phage protein